MRYFIFLLLFIFVIYSPLYDFGTMQEGNTGRTFPGGNISFNLYFFMDEKYGDRIAHIRVIPADVPAGWEVSTDPPIHPVRLNISGIVTTAEENIYVEPKPVLPEVPPNPEPGIHYLFSPSGLGYLQAKRVTVTFRIPEDAELGQTYNLKIDGYANWYGPTAGVALTQSRPFRYSVTVAAREYSEEVLPFEEAVNETTNEPRGTAGGLEGEEDEGGGLDSNTLVMGAMGLVILLLIAYIIIRPAKKA